MAGPGNTIPKPESQRRRRNAPMANTLKLPAEGRRGRAPSWPLEVDPSDAEARLWTKLWHTPQAVAWERQGWTRTVARYVRVLIPAEERLDEKLLPEARQLEDRLGLSPMAMLRLRWEVTADEVSEQRDGARASRYEGLRVADLG